MPSSKKASSFSLEKDGKQALVDWAFGFGLRISDVHLQCFRMFLSELQEWNHKFNLVGPASEAEIVRELLLDSLIPCPLLPDEGALLDVGSGAGFPAIPIKICKPELRVLLLEPHRKKCSFLKQVIRVTGLKAIEVVRGRIEEGARLLCRQGYQVITGRASLSVEQMLTRCGPYLAERGLMVHFLGGNAEEIFASCRERMEAEALRVFKVIPYALPMKGSQRHVVVLIKDGKKTSGQSPSAAAC